MQDAPETRSFDSTRLRQAAQEADLTQQAIATRLGMSMRAVQNWFLGEREPGGSNLVALAELLGREPAWFYTAREESQPA